MIVGIDLGTTNSLVAYFTEDGPKIIPNRLNKNLTPSIVSMDEDGQIYVGETARERMLLNPDTAASVFKRDMGNQKKYKLCKKEFTAEELSSFVLRSLKEDAEHYLKEPITEAVISVPAYFNDQRRKATKRAGELAGLRVERIISEPTAAAIAYGLYQNRENAKFLVFDLGGGTFDVSILELFDNIIEVRAVAGDNYLGGEDFTNVLENMFFEKEHGLERTELTPKQLRHIHKQADLCKLGFSDGEESEFVCMINEKEYRQMISMSEYETACEELFEKIREPIKRSLSDAHVRIHEIDKIVLVGGATKLPIVRRFVSKLFRMIPDTNINPDEAIALGAAIQGAMKERKDAIKEVILTDVCPYTLGTEVVEHISEHEYRSGRFLPIIERNTVIPASRTETLTTVHNNQTELSIKIFQGESHLTENDLLLGELVIDVPSGPAGAETVDVTYTYDVNSILEVQVRATSTKKLLTKVLKGSEVDMTDEEIKQRFEQLAYLKILPREKEENKLLLLQGERMYEEMLGRERELVRQALSQFECSLDTQDPKVIEDARRVFKKFIEDMNDVFRT